MEHSYTKEEKEKIILEFEQKLKNQKNIDPEFELSDEDFWDLLEELDES